MIEKNKLKVADATGAQASCLHECEARKDYSLVELLSVDAAEAAALQARMPAVQSVDHVKEITNEI